MEIKVIGKDETSVIVLQDSDSVRTQQSRNRRHAKRLQERTP